MRANWVRDIEDIPGVPAIKATMFEANVRDLSLPNGKLGGLPYYSGFNSFVFNAKHLERPNCSRRRRGTSSWTSAAS